MSKCKSKTAWDKAEPRHREQVIFALLYRAQQCEQEAAAAELRGLNEMASAFRSLAQAFLAAAVQLGYADDSTVKLAT